MKMTVTELKQLIRQTVNEMVNPKLRPALGTTTIETDVIAYEDCKREYKNKIPSGIKLSAGEKWTDGNHSVRLTGKKSDIIKVLVNFFGCDNNPREFKRDYPELFE